jgi:hypothetical protein
MQILDVDQLYDVILEDLSDCELEVRVDDLNAEFSWRFDFTPDDLWEAIDQLKEDNIIETITTEPVGQTVLRLVENDW